MSLTYRQLYEFLYSRGFILVDPALYQSKLVVFRSMSKFLRVALCSPTPRSDENSPPTTSNPTWCLSSAFPEPNAYESFDALFRPTINLPPDTRPPIRRWKVEIDPDDDDEHFAFNCKSTQYDSVDAPYTLQDLHDVISSTTLNDFDLDSRLANRQSDFEMVCFTSYMPSWPSPFTSGYLARGTGTPSGSPV